MALSTQTDFYLNLNKLSEMKLDARQNSAEASQGVAQQFESLFVQQMLAAMRSAARVDEASHSSYTDFYQEMHDKQLALTMARQGGLGLTKFIMQQLPGGQNNSGKSGEILPLHEYQEVATPPVISQMNYRPENPAVKVKPLINEDKPSVTDTDLQTSSQGNWNTAQAFIRDILPQAKSAANMLGVSPGLLVAQSALETGWGKHVMTREDGSSAFNLFGIKAGSGWQGDTVSKPTMEFRNGVMQTEVAHFRVYDSLADSLDDYVSFIQSRERYQDALKHGGNDGRYINALQNAGYATDPDYADKILSILQGSQLRTILKGDTTHA
ncbi:MAG: flagellar assembly peptidoglycan hydrolase FlgJ [Gammaproteobacteria bacterium]|nr:flagellar assembly peptidoglycan hydrolase FlgJ [Gammaproteobacteria bacterium]